MLHVIPVMPLDIEATARLTGFIQDREIYHICIDDKYKKILQNAAYSFEGISTTVNIPLENQIDFWIKHQEGFAQEALLMENRYLFVPQDAFPDWKKWLASNSEERIIFYEPILDPTALPVAMLCQSESFEMYSITVL